MNIKIDESVMAYMAKKGKNTITLNVHKSGGGCCPTFEVAEVEMKAPNNTDDYNHFTQDGIDIYVAKTAKIATPVLKFTLEKSFFSKEIVPVGLMLKKHV